MGLLILTMLTALNLVEVNAKDGLHPAQIFGKHASTVGDEVEFVCSTFGFRLESDEVHVYLCKNGDGIKQQIQTNKFDSKFHIKSVKKEHTGNYSCVFSKSKYELTDVTGKGDSSIFHQVSAGFLPGNIALTETSVKGGSDVEFTCTVSDIRRTDLSRNLSYTYLCKDGAAVQIKLWDRENHGATFTLRKVSVEDSGNYSCVVFVSKFLANEMELHGNNAVELQVHGSAFGCQYSCVYKLYAVVVLFSVLLISSVLLGFWRFRLHLKQGQGGEANQSGKNLECLSERNESGCVQPEVNRGEETRLDALQTTPNNKGQMDMSVH